MAERKRTRVCGSCRFRQQTGSYINGVELVECRRRAPTPEVMLAGQRAVWPLLLAEAWCGEWGEV